MEEEKQKRMEKKAYHPFYYLRHLPSLAKQERVGVSVETALYKTRINDLRKIKADTHFLSLEPLLGPLGKLDLDDIEWVIAGGESGFNFRECKIGWVREIRDQCVKSNVPFFFKQWGGITSKAKGRT